jgi:hypothetical protein
MLWPLILIGLGIVVVCHALGRSGGGIVLELICGVVCVIGGVAWFLVLLVT